MCTFQCSSASRKFLNWKALTTPSAGISFQCSSASRKFLNRRKHIDNPLLRARFSALQRAENSSISQPGLRVLVLQSVSVLFSEPKIPQSLYTFLTKIKYLCFSALQRAENSSIQFEYRAGKQYVLGFSALQRAENSSMVAGEGSTWRNMTVSVLFSEPKIPQSTLVAFIKRAVGVSVLFSEPKIPQCTCGASRQAQSRSFSALQRAENSSMHTT